MDLTELRQLRLANLQISSQKFSDPARLMRYMIAVQAQDRQMAEWAIGLRCNTNSIKVNTDLDKGTILRTHILRPTWHFLHAADLSWMLALSAARIKASMRSRNHQLGLSGKVFSKSNSIIQHALENEGELTRDELVPFLKKAKIKTGDTRAAHLTLWAELEGLVTSGKGPGHRYALVANRVKASKTITKEQALGKLAGSYFKSRGPATLADFTWWSGLSPKEAREALEMISSKLVCFALGKDEYWYEQPTGKVPASRHSVYILPAYDEFLLSYKNRSAVLDSDMNAQTISSNGLFRPVVVINGKIKGLWKRVIQNNNVTIELEMFKPPGAGMKMKIRDAARKFAGFLGKEGEFIFK